MSFRRASISSFRLRMNAPVATAALTCLLAASGVAGCGDDGGSGSDDIGATSTATGLDGSTGVGMPTHDADIQPIWNEHCSVDGCHTPGLFLPDLSSGSAYDNIVDVASTSSLPFITPGDPQMSYLWHKLNNTQSSVGGGGIQMPSPRPGMAATVVTPLQLETIETWINDGAPQ